MVEIPSNIFTFNIKEDEYGIINAIKQKDDGSIKIDETITPILRSGKWKTCQMNDELFVIGIESLIQDFMNIQEFYDTVNQVNGNQYTRDEYNKVSDMINTKKKQMDLSSKVINANEMYYIGDYNPDSLLEFTVESEEDEKFSESKQVKIASSFSNPYGVDRIIDTGEPTNETSYVYNIPWDYNVRAVESIIGDVIGFIITKNEKQRFDPSEFFNVIQMQMGSGEENEEYDED